MLLEWEVEGGQRTFHIGDVDTMLIIITRTTSKKMVGRHIAIQPSSTIEVKVLFKAYIQQKNQTG